MYFEVGQVHIAEEDTTSRNVVQESGLGVQDSQGDASRRELASPEHPEPHSSPTEPELLAGKAGNLTGSPR